MKVFEDGVKGNQILIKSDGSANAINTLTVPARAGHFPVLDNFTFSSSDDPGAGTLVTITIGSTVVWNHYVKYGGPGPIDLDALATGIKGETATIVAAAGGAGIIINLSAKYR